MWTCVNRFRKFVNRDSKTLMLLCWSQLCSFTETFPWWRERLLWWIRLTELTSEYFEKLISKREYLFYLFRSLFDFFLFDFNGKMRSFSFRSSWELKKKIIYIHSEMWSKHWYHPFINIMEFSEMKMEILHPNEKEQLLSFFFFPPFSDCF